MRWLILTRKPQRPALVEAAAGKGRTLRLGTVFFQHYFQHPDPAAFAPLLAWLNLPAEPVTLLNPSAQLRMRRLSLPRETRDLPRGMRELPEGELLILLNGGGPATARLQLAPGRNLTRLTINGEEPVDIGAGVLEVAMHGQNAEVFLSQ